MDTNKDFNIVVNDFADLIKMEVDIVKHICRFEDNLKKTGENWQGPHSTHSGKDSNSFSINVAESYYRCFSCDEGGDVISYEQHRLSCSPLEAMKSLATEYNIDIPDLSGYHNMTSEQKEEFDKQSRQYKRIEQLQRDYLSFSIEQLTDEHRSYLQERGLTIESIKEFQLGYASPELKALMINEGYTLDELNSSGLFMDQNKQILENRILIPTFDRQKKPCHFVGRSLETKHSIPKYLSQRSNQGQNQQAVYRAIWQYGSYHDKLLDDKTYKPIVVVEGCIDALLAAQEFKDRCIVMCSNTTTFSNNQINQLATDLVSIGKRTIIICNDNDNNGAGHKGAVSTIERLHEVISNMVIDSDADQDMQKEQEGELEWIIPDTRICTLRRPPELKKIDLADFISMGRKGEAWYWIQAAVTLDQYNQKLVGDSKRFFQLGPKGGKTKLIHQTVVDEIFTDGNYFAYAGDELYWYSNGVYKLCESEVQVLIKQKLAKDATAMIINKIYDLVVISAKDSTISSKYEDSEEEKTWVNTKNGWINFAEIPNSHEPLPHNPYKVSFIRINATYSKDAVSEIYEKFISEVLHEVDIREWFKMLGYVLVRTLKYQKAFMLTGIGGNGKSTAIEVLQDIIGNDNFWVTSLKDLEKDKFASADLYGKIANFHTDLPPGYVPSEGKFKPLVAGEQLSAQHKYGHSFKFRPECTLIFSANEIPRTNDTTYAYYRRWKYFAFDRRFSETADEDVNLLQKLITEEQKSGILNLAWFGYSLLLEDGGFKETEHSSRIKGEYQESNDIIVAFVNEGLIPTNEDSDLIHKQELYNTFKQYLNSTGSGREKVSAIRFNRRLKQLIPNLVESQDTENNNRRCWRCIKFDDKFIEEIELEATTESY